MYVCAEKYPLCSKEAKHRAVLILCYPPTAKDRRGGGGVSSSGSSIILCACSITLSFGEASPSTVASPHHIKAGGGEVT